MVVAAILASAGFCLLGLAAVSYVAFHYLQLIYKQQAQPLRLAPLQPAQAPPFSGLNISDPKEHDAVQELLRRMAPPSEGDFVPHSDEDAWRHEQVAFARRDIGGDNDELTQREMEELIAATGVTINSNEP